MKALICLIFLPLSLTIQAQEYACKKLNPKDYERKNKSRELNPNDFKPSDKYRYTECFIKRDEKLVTEEWDISFKLDREKNTCQYREGVNKRDGSPLIDSIDGNFIAIKLNDGTVYPVIDNCSDSNIFYAIARDTAGYLIQGPEITVDYFVECKKL